MPLPVVPFIWAGTALAGVFGLNSLVKNTGEASGELSKVLVLGASAVAIAAVIKKL